MKKKIDGLTIAERRRLMQVQIREAVEKHGCMVMGVGAQPHFSYSIGIPTTFPGASEVMLFSLSFETMAHIINNVVQKMREGATFEAGKRYEGLIEGMPVYFGEVDPEHYDNYFGQAQVYHKSETGFPVLQLVWPDTHGKFPWERGFEEKFRSVQPLLFVV